MSRIKWFRHAFHVGAPLISLLLMVFAWHVVVVSSNIEPFLLPGPALVMGAVREEWRLLLHAMWVTGSAALLGFLSSALAGVFLGILLAQSKVLERSFYPYALVLQTVPIVAIAPLLVLWFGVGMKAVIASACIVSVFPVITNTLAGIKSIDPRLHDLFTLYRASWFARLVRLQLPAASASIAAGLRIAAGLSVIGAIVGELVAGFSEGDAGLGIVIMSAYRQLRTDLLFGAVLCSALLSIAVFSFVSLLSWILMRGEQNTEST